MITLKFCIVFMALASIFGVVFAIKEGNKLADKTLGAFILGMVGLGVSLIPVSIIVLAEMALRVIFG